jgi:hypothetical protein
MAPRLQAPAERSRQLVPGRGRARRAALTNMASVNQLVATAVVEKVRVALGCEGPALWRRVADAMQLTHAQREDVVQLWRSFRRAPAPTPDAVGCPARDRCG